MTVLPKTEPFLVGLPKPSGAMRKLVATPHAAAQYRRPSLEVASIADECEVLLTVGALRSRGAQVGFFGRLNRE